ncbi:hypothetical protein [Oerskovia flava]|uniref:hypothetical protein n=1 Tax=Oerskovia flava TaxID=2986422 RepID=UPI00224037A2|nr:hypothetical protein [Oerskovia sp. JB1-3-2]
MVQRCRTVSEEITETVTRPVKKVVEQLSRVCRKLPWPLSWLCGVIKKLVEIIEWVVETFVRVVTRVVCVTISIAVKIWDGVAFVAQKLWNLPLIGPIARWALGLGSWVISQFVGIVDGVAGLFGIRPTKRLRLHVFLLTSRREGLLATPQDAAGVLRETERILRARAEVAVRTTVHVIETPAPDNALHIDTGVGLLGEDLTGAGAYFQKIMTDAMPDENLARTLRYGAPIAVFVVRSVGDTETGCSAGPLADWVAVERGQLAPATPPGGGGTGWHNTLAHEIGHACGLMHTDDPTNLLHPQGLQGARGDNLSPFQRMIVRSSPHVTYL